ncbi:response regulator transcription factor [candidate division CSSED10-310 bacterium]|uniref:Response regulator transcription factor n=1 Tax=candidate division CSSED10-310 bacterium TaxID=2855610 RepID=A0ABV6YRH0_UNCC1
MINVLIVDNFPSILDLLRLALRDYWDTLTVHTARDGLEAYRILHSHQIDLLITDLIMPRVSGFELIHYVNNFQSHIPVIVMTASVPFIELAREDLSIKHFFLKPFPLESFIEVVLSEIYRSSKPVQVPTYKKLLR